MGSGEMDIAKYLLRIGFNHPTEPTLDVLRSLHRRHLLAVPFENLTLHCGGRVSPHLPAVYHKVVTQRRGGFCFENNGLFSWLLSELGFEVTVLSGQVKNSTTGRYGPPFDHLISMVSLGGRRWLCDVGFGSAGFSVPLSLDVRAEPQTVDHRVYRVRAEEEQRFLEWRGDPGQVPDGEWMGIYKFTLEPRRRENFTEMCDYHQSSPSSIFFCKSVCTIPTPGGRLSLVGRRLTTTTYPTQQSAFKTTTPPPTGQSAFKTTTTYPTQQSAFKTTTPPPTGQSAFKTTTPPPTGQSAFKTTTTYPTQQSAFKTTTTYPTQQSAFKTTTTYPTQQSAFKTTTTYPTQQSAFKTTTRTLEDEEIPAILEKMFGVVLPSPLVPKDEAILPPPVMY